MTIELRGDVAIVRISGKGPENRLTPGGCLSLYADLREAERSDAVRSIVLSGGPEAFCAGFDDAAVVEMKRAIAAVTPFVDEAIGATAISHPTYLSAFPTLFSGRPSKPSIAAISGACLGFGFAIMGLHSDVRLCTPDARFGFPDTLTGIAGGIAAASALRMQVSSIHLNWLVETASTVSADDAVRIGLVNDIVSSSELETRAFALAKDAADRYELCREAKSKWWHGDVGFPHQGWPLTATRLQRSDT
ncbi:MAG TPA: enoyl-CoA hydratase/isomerase family protein [Steroidobacteraceae bacterium]|jgi:enoyl-CoA hydratase/carnithine racemase